LGLKGENIGTTKVRKTTTRTRKALDGSLVLWTRSWELFDLSPPFYTLELAAFDRARKVVNSRTEKLLHCDPSLKK
jgi:hypothetical protein